MLLKLIYICFATYFVSCEAGVMFWSNKHLEISPLLVFTDEDLNSLKEKLNNPKIINYQGSFKISEENLPKILQNLQTSYVPNAVLNFDSVPENSIVHVENNTSALEQEILKSKVNTQENILVIMTSDEDKREKRSVIDPTISPPDIPTDGMLYSDDKGIAMIYSARLPILTVNDHNDSLGKPSSVTLDQNKAKSYTKVLVTIPFDGSKLVLRFKFNFGSGYWSFAFIEVITTDNKSFNLTAPNQIVVPEGFSYHCNDISIFSNVDKNVTLQLFDMQLQPDSKKGSFGDAYDCVPFMTGPIWSGLFVTFILMMVLALGIGALGSIKTMDKFETSKSKQLLINVSE